jgi:hypothetical protein
MCMLAKTDFKSEDFDIVSQHVQNNNCKSTSNMKIHLIIIKVSKLF